MMSLINKYCRNRTIGITRAVRVAPIIFVIIVLTVSAQFRETRVLTSNNIIGLAGSGDTVWLATERGFNYRTSNDVSGGWLGFEVDDLSLRYWGMAFGGGGVAALIDMYQSNVLNRRGFWHFDHTGNRQQEVSFRFSDGAQGPDRDMANPAGSVVYSHGSFWAPFNNGGLVRYNPQDNSVSAIKPGDASAVPPQNMTSDESAEDARRRSRLVLSVNASPAGNSIIVTTPAIIWSYNPGASEKTWDTLHASPNPLSASTGETFVSFVAAFTVSKKDVSALYAFMAVRRDSENDTLLYSYDDDSGQWFRTVDTRARFSVFPAINGGMYVLFDDNRAALFADTAQDATARENHLSEILTPANFRSMLANAGNDPNPKINDIIFLPRTDTAGILIVAAETGVYVSESINPLTAGHTDYRFSHSRHVSPVAPGKAYALPGIIRNSFDNKYDRCVFVYNLRREGNVTIRVYDYNMALVRTVVRGAPRASGANSASGRSTDPARDFWDGTNASGRMVSPGVYYFKITSTGGERFFGKVVLAR
ncbi:MAG: hypothetical protein LBC70_04460 [Chitinispirillales bacterium]|jgi:hypothetical protein|nr:hypothetical protein [Chitinispirillales bacterium]